MNSPGRRWQVLAEAGLVGLLAIQLLALGNGLIRPWVARIVRNPGLPVIQRSLAFGDGFSWDTSASDIPFMEFIRATVPEDSHVVMAPDSHIPWTYQPTAGYFLFPRPVSTCSREWTFDQCYRFLIGPQGYLVSFGGFPDPDEASPRMEFCAWADGFGVYAPRGKCPGS